MHCGIGLDTRIGDWARLDDMSALGDGASMAHRRKPARLARGAGRGRRARARRPPTRKRRRPFLYGAIHLGLIYAMGYFLIAERGARPSPWSPLRSPTAGRWWGVAAAFAAVPSRILWYVLLLVAVKRLCIGRIEPASIRSRAPNTCATGS